MEKIKILICSGTSGISGGAEQVEKNFRTELKLHKLTDKCNGVHLVHERDHVLSKIESHVLKSVAHRITRNLASVRTRVDQREGAYVLIRWRK